MHYITILDFQYGSVDQYNLADHFDKTTLILMDSNCVNIIIQISF